MANLSTASALYQNKKNDKFTNIALEARCALSCSLAGEAAAASSSLAYVKGQ